MSSENPAPEGVRIHKWLAQNGVLSRRKAEEAMTAGRVRVNGEVVRDLGRRIDPSRDRIELDGKPIATREERFLYRFYKPKGVVTSLSDPEGRPTVADYFPSGQRLYPVGRLDLASEGLLLLTNDGELSLRLTHPRYQIRKEYEVTVEGTPSADAHKRWLAGVELEDGPGRFDAVEALGEEGGPASPGRTRLRIVVSEGRNRFIRRMCSALGFEVRRLQRTRMGPFEIGRLRPGDLERVPPSEHERVREALLAAPPHSRQKRLVPGKPLR